MLARIITFIFLVVLLQVPAALAARKEAPVLSSIYLGNPANGVKLSGPLAGKKAYVLPSAVNRPNCWVDSVFWTGSELVYTMTALSFTRTISNQPAFTINPSCKLPVAQPNLSFNLYAASPGNKTWYLTRLPINDFGKPYLTSPSLGGQTMAYISAEKGASYLGNIYFSEYTGRYRWSAPKAFPYNSSSCKEDNPHLYADGKIMIFESNRADAAATSCVADHQKLWISALDNGVWSTPVLLTGAPTKGNQSFQPWVDAEGKNIYWTADNSLCGDGAMNCVMTASLKKETSKKASAVDKARNWSGSYTKIITPAPLVPGASNGKIVLAGEYSQVGNMAFFACGIARETDPKGLTPTLFDGRWTITLNICAIPLR